MEVLFSPSVAMAQCSQDFLRGWGGGGVGRGVHIVSHPRYLHAPLQVFGPANGVCNYLVLEKIYGKLNLGICTF